MIHAVTKYGPLVTRDGPGFPIKEDRFKAKRGNGGDRGQVRYSSVMSLEHSFGGRQDRLEETIMPQ